MQLTPHHLLFRDVNSKDELQIETPISPGGATGPREEPALPPTADDGSGRTSDTLESVLSDYMNVPPGHTSEGEREEETSDTSAHVIESHPDEASYMDVSRLEESPLIKILQGYSEDE